MRRLVPMPSPRGTNYEGLYVDARWVVDPQAAYDSKHGLARDDDLIEDPNKARGTGGDAEELPSAGGFETSLECACGRVLYELRRNGASPELVEELKRALGMTDGATDEPPDFSGKPRPGGGHAMDAQFTKRYPGATLRVDRTGEQPQRGPARTSAAGAKSFAERYPGAAAIRVL
jgi:hypothetical protein